MTRNTEQLYVDALDSETSKWQPAALDCTPTVDWQGHPCQRTDLHVPGFEVLGEIGRGGMGIVLRARDLELDRDVAVKILRDVNDDSSVMVLRFVQEAHIAGQLQHPGIAPIYRMGKLQDQSPFFAMKLIEGQTMAELLAQRKEPSGDRPRMLKVFEQICQTLAYAHSHRVIHRDLKPANVMVGAFGEVQVMDWGLAKVLPGPETAKQREPAAAKSDVSAIRTPLGQPPGLVTETSVGSVLGTPSYMAQEQALGEVERIDERSDVFSLGAILCQILTGRPPYVAEDLATLFHKAARADLADALARIDACGADAELIALNKRCLARDRDGRPRNAIVLSAELTEYLESVEARLRRAELDRAQAEVRAQEERRRWLLTVALGIALLLFGGATGGGLLWYRSRHTETERIVSSALGKSVQLRDVAVQMGIPTLREPKPGIELLDQAAEDLRQSGAIVTAWKQAHAAVQEAESALTTGISSQSLQAHVIALRSEIDQCCQRIDKAHEQLAREEKLLRDLDDARMASAVSSEGKNDYAGSTKRYVNGFAKYGLPVLAGKANELAARTATERPTIKDAIILALDNWTYCAVRSGDSASANELKTKAAYVDTDEWRKRLRETDDAKTLLGLSREARQGQVSVSSICSLAWRLKSCGQSDSAAELLRWARGRYPADFWVHFDLGNLLGEAESPTNAEVVEGVGCFRSAVALRPNSAAAHNNLGIALSTNSQLDEAMDEFRLAIQLDPKNAMAHTNLGIALRDKKQLDEAIAEYRLAIEIDPELPMAHINLGAALAAKNQLDEAIAEYQLAIKSDSKIAQAHYNLGTTLMTKGMVDEAISSFHQAIQLSPRFVRAHYNLGLALARKGQFNEAISEFRIAVNIDPRFALARSNLAAALFETKQFDESIAEGRLAIELDSRDPRTHLNLGLALAAKNQFDEAIAEYHLALEIHPKFATAHANLGEALRSRGDFTLARNSFQRAYELFATGSQAKAECAELIEGVDRLMDLEARLAKTHTAADHHTDNADYLKFVEVCRLKRRFGTAANLYSLAFAADSKLAEELKASHRYNAACYATLAGSGQGEEAATLDDAARAKLRGQAIVWLRADLAAWQKLLVSGIPDEIALAQQTLRNWQGDSDLSSLRDAVELAKLPAEERETCQSLWAEVAGALAK